MCQHGTGTAAATFAYSQSILVGNHLNSVVDHTPVYGKILRRGYYERSLETTSGKVKLNVPGLRAMPFESAIIGRYKRRACSVEEALIEMCLAGVSVRRVEDIVVAAKLRAMKLTEAANIFEVGIGETLSYMNYPREHWMHLRTNNPMKRIMKEIRSQADMA